MITGFERETHSLSESEIVEAKLLANGINNSKFKHIPHNAAFFIEAFERVHGITLTEVRFRKLVNYIRNQNLVIGFVSNNKGYYVTEDPLEFLRFLQSLKDRIEEQTVTYKNQVEQFKKKFPNYK